jgi:hypothetical protein
MPIRQSVIILAIFFTPPITVAQHPTNSPTTPQDFWVNLESSPLVFEINESRRVLYLYNYGLKRVSSYRLGCVSSTPGKVRILRKMPVTTADLEPNQWLLNSVYVYAKDKARCDKVQAKLAVVEVRFSDGSRWKQK